MKSETTFLRNKGQRPLLVLDKNKLPEKNLQVTL